MSTKHLARRAFSGDPSRLSSIRVLRGALSLDNVRPMVTFSFDDGNRTDYTQAYTRMHAAGMRGTSYLAWEQIHHPERTSLTHDQIHEMATNGWEIGCHAFAHPDLTDIHRLPHDVVAGGPFVASEIITGSVSGATGTVAQVTEEYLVVTQVAGAFVVGDTITGDTSGASTIISGPVTMEDADILAQFTENKRRLEELTGKVITSHAYPHSKHNAAVANLTSAVYEAAVLTEYETRCRYGYGGKDYGQALFELPRFFIDKREMGQIKGRIDEAVRERNQWLIFGAHGIEGRSERKSPQEFQEIIDYVKAYKIAGKVDVVTVAEGARRIL